LLGKGSASKFPRQGIDAVIDELLEVVISLRFAPSYKREFVTELSVPTRVEAGSNTSTVTLRVVGCDEKEVLNLRQ
jgi:hypothetical protein